MLLEKSCQEVDTAEKRRLLCLEQAELKKAAVNNKIREVNKQLKALETMFVREKALLVQSVTHTRSTIEKAETEAKTAIKAEKDACTSLRNDQQRARRRFEAVQARYVAEETADQALYTKEWQLEAVVRALAGQFGTEF